MVKYKKIMAPFIVLAMVAVIWVKTGIYFETNDDKCITEILCGQMTGAPQARTVYVSYLLTLPVSLLYRITAGVPWYGLALVLLQVIAYTAVLESVYSRCRKIWDMAAGTVFLAVVMLMDLYILGCIEYTSTSGLLAAAGYFCLLLHKEPKKGWFRFCLLELLAGLLRINAMLMVQPLGFLAVAGLFLVKEGKSFRERLTVLGRVALPPAAVFLAVLAVDAFVYRGSDWKAYMKFNDAEEVLFDYVGVPPYDEVREILDNHQVTETDYNAYANYMILDWVISPECAQELAAYAQEHREEWNISGLWQELLKHLLDEPFWGLNRVLLFLWAALAALAFLWRDKALLLPALGLLAGKLFSWTFLLWEGRFPLRVSMPLIAGEVLLLSALLLRRGTDTELQGNPKRLRYVGLGALLFGMCIAGFMTGRQQYSYILNENRGQKIFMEGLREIRAYCDARPENRYILDAVSMSYYKGSALEYEVYQGGNYIVSGSWYSNSPYLRKYNAEYLSGGDGIYFLVYDGGGGISHPGVSYLIQETGVQPEICDRITVSPGGTYLVYYFDGKYCIEES